MVKVLRPFMLVIPPSGQRNHDWLVQFDKLHGTSQEYWKVSSTIFRQIYKKHHLTDDEVETCMETLSFWHNKEYTSRLEAKRQQVLREMQKPKIPESEDVFLPLPNTTETAETSASAQPKAKTKTRGEPAPGEAAHVRVDDIAEDLETTRITVRLPKRSYATFRCMFPELIEERQKSIDWNVFVDSMADAGFTASNSGGSMVTFKNGAGKIIFHRPHPEPSIDPIMLQSMGNRMNKWFGWERETFVLAKK